MLYRTPSIPAIECPPLVPDNTPVLICPSCGDTMLHLRTIPKLGARLEQFIFVCPSCEQDETKEVLKHAATPHYPNLPKSVVDFIVPARVNAARLMPMYFANYSQRRDLIRRIR